MTLVSRLVVAACVALALVFSALAPAEDGDNVPGPPAVDQSDAPSSQVPAPVAAIPVSVSGGGVGPYRTTTWDTAAADTTKDLAVITSSAAGTSALTGVVAAAGTPVPGAAVSLEQPGGSHSARTTSNADGAYAFVDIPPGTYVFAVTASGYGTLTVTDDSYEPNQYYERTVSLTGAPRTYSAADPPVLRPRR